MPCSDNMSAYFEALYEELKKDPDKFIESKVTNIQNAIKPELNELVDYMKSRLNKTTRLLCFVCNTLFEKRGICDPADFPILRETKEWWEEHKKADDKRTGED